MVDREKQKEMFRDSIASVETFILRHEEKIQAWEQRLEAFESSRDDAPALLARCQMEFLVLNALGIVEERKRSIASMRAELAWIEQQPAQPQPMEILPYSVPFSPPPPNVDAEFVQDPDITDYRIVYGTASENLAIDVKLWILKGWQPFGSLQVTEDNEDRDEKTNQFFQPMVMYAPV